VSYDLFSPEDAEYEATVQLCPGPILETVEIMEADPKWSVYFPAKVWLLFTDDGRNKKVRERTEWLSRHLESKGIVTKQVDLTVSDPSDYRFLIPSMNAAISGIRAEDSTSEFVILTSPGTPQMSVTWIILGNEGRLPGLYLQKREGRRETDENKNVVKRYDSGSLATIPLSPLFESEKVARICGLLQDHMAFSSCQVLLTDLAESTLLSQRKSMYESAALLCSVLDSWDRSDYKQARQILNDNKNLAKVVLDKVEPAAFDTLIASLKLLDSGDLTERTKNLFARAERKHVTGSFVSCVLDTFTCYEVLLIGTLRKYADCKNDAEQGDILDKENRLLGNSIEIKRKDGRKNTTHKGVCPHHQGMASVRGSTDLSARIDAARVLRNKIVHSGRQVSDTESSKTLENVKLVVSAFLGVQPDEITRFPFTTGFVSRLGTALKDVTQVA